MKNTDNMLEDNGISTKFPSNNKLTLFFMPFILIPLKDGSWHILVPFIIVTERTKSGTSQPLPPRDRTFSVNVRVCLFLDDHAFIIMIIFR